MNSSCPDVTKYELGGHYYCLISVFSLFNPCLFVLFFIILFSCYRYLGYVFGLHSDSVSVLTST